MEEKEVMAAAAETAESAQVTEQKNGSTEMDRVLTTRQLVVNGLAWLCPACIVMYSSSIRCPAVHSRWSY